MERGSRLQGMRQECPLSLLLFNMRVANIEKELGKDRVGGVKIGTERLRVAGYADNLMILAEDEKGMRWLLKGLERYMEEKRLVVNVEKTKVTRFGKSWRGWGRQENGALVTTRQEAKRGGDVLGL